jgi:multidrug efflux pump subunit AcrB
MVDIDPQKLYGKGLSPADVSNALNAQNVILPAGTQKIGDREYNVRLNSSPELLQTLNDLPIKQVNNAMVYIRDVAHVRDGFAVQTNIVAQNRVRSALLTVLKSASASTLDIISRVKAALPRIKATLPPELDITQLFDQSIFVRAAINGVVKEGVIAACLTALMILLFLGSWRSTLVVATSIPLSILCSVIILSALGQTLNLMTLGGLALAVGILVDDATVEIENIHRNLAMKKPMVRAILDGASQIAVPAFVSTLCICIVFVPIFFLSGTARFLFQPLAMAVIFAMLASYLLSRTVVPTMVRFLLREHLDEIDTSLAQSVEGSDGGEEKIANRSRENPTAPHLSGLGQIFGFLGWIHEKPKNDFFRWGTPFAKSFHLTKSKTCLIISGCPQAELISPLAIVQRSARPMVKSLSPSIQIISQPRNTCGSCARNCIAIFRTWNSFSPRPISSVRF